MKCRVLESGIAYMTQPFHINGAKGYNYDHWGVDLVDYSSGYSTLGWIVAHSGGTILETRNNCTGFEQNSYGNYVLMKHDNGMYTLYAHLSYGTVQVYAGQRVSKGTRLGYMGNTGTSYGGHLHFEIRNKNNSKIDPEPYLDKELSSMSWVQKWFLYDSKGKMQTGWHKVDGDWYFLDKTTGEMQTGWLKNDGKWYYLADNGKMQTGWQKIYGKWYYFAGGDSGKMLTGWQKINGKWYYLNPTQTADRKEGEMWTGWLKNKGYWYYLDPKDGYMYTGTHTIDGKSYTFDSSGRLVS